MESRVAAKMFKARIGMEMAAVSQCFVCFVCIRAGLFKARLS